jgi:hypothetical protein
MKNYGYLGKDSQQGGNNKENKQKRWWNKYKWMMDEQLAF